MVLSKSLKAKLSSILSGVVSLSTPSLDLETTVEKIVAAVTSPHSTTRHGDN